MPVGWIGCEFRFTSDPRAAHDARATRSIPDRQLEQAGWIVQDYRDMHITAGLGVAIREFALLTGTADYLLYVDGQIAGVIEAKPEGRTLAGVETQSAKY